ncbi:DNA ligase D [Sphingomonas endophytica]|uniref:DNA ligase (ATP) n=1 Tax=Sphingomonas endophytica TaxID=869719 RepID=A0A147I5D7_9SPHN|nr:DNA ligase D [Sphingomonas endophytica]KTT73860.1 ATP-dependent DNA ligase [Sphingomonas endophytica]
MPDRDPLERYNAKRDFTRTAEPAGTLAAGHGNGFIVQKHDATRLHWDFRLEVDGVLKSWAVTRGPSLDPDEKRLAVRTEDHPLSYATFEGTIPAGEYGGGTVMLWDRGTWSPVKGKSAADIEKGHLHFVLDGERMKGEWLLIRLRPRGKEKRENWLLRKIADAEAGGTDVLVETALTSVATGRTMQEIAEGKKVSRKAVAPAKAGAQLGDAGDEGETGRSWTPASAGVTKKKKSGRAAKAPPFEPPQLCTLVDHVPTGSDWLHEVKYDGYRALVAVGGGTAKVFTRSGLDWTDKFPGIAEAAAALPATSALVDGEIVAFKDGRPDFSTLKDAIGAGGDMTLFAFDLLEVDGEDLRALPNVTRKERLRALVGAGEERLRFAEHVIGSGEELFETMCREGYEGVVSKRADAPYRGKRTSAWLKIKCIRRQEFVIVGWLPSTKSRGLRSLLLGVHDGDTLRYAGKVGTGFDAATIDELRTRLDRLARKTPTVDAPRAAVKGAHWVTPKLVAEVAFAETTPDGVLRHSSFIGLRGDKPAREVVAERAAPVPAPTTVKVTNRERVIFPDSDITKGQLADYYATMAGVMLPWAGHRPISLVRCPQGRARACFFQKHDAGSFGDAVHQVPIREKDGSTENYLYVDDTAGLVTCVQMGTIEFHGWGSRVDALETPDRMVFDLDPDEGLGFEETKRAAVYLKEQLAELGLISFALLSGGKGVHVVVPLTPDAEWPRVKDFADRFARALAQAEPERFVAVATKAKRKGRIFIDYLRNQRGATAIMPYAARARPGAPVAAPVSWSELRDLDTAARWSVGDMDALLERANGRALAGWGVADQLLPDF